MKTRPYRIVQAGNDDITLVRATNKEQALRYAARKIFSVTLATEKDIYECGKRGDVIEDANGNEYVRDSHGVLTGKE